jgi:hypothetical protein
MSKRKPLLTESELRRFMKLANMGPLGNERLTEMFPPAAPAVREEDEEAQLHDLEDAEDDMDHADDLEADAAEDLGDLGGDDLDMDMGQGEGDLQDIAMQLVDAMGEVLAQHGIELTATETDDAGLEGGEPEEMDAMDDVALDAVDDLEAVEVEDEEVEELPGGRDMYEQKEEFEEELTLKKNAAALQMDREAAIAADAEEKRKERKKKINLKRSDLKGLEEKEVPAPSQDDMVAEIAKRVAVRLEQENQKDNLVDQLAERIMARLTKK